MLNVVTGPAQVIGDEILDNPRCGSSASPAQPRSESCSQRAPHVKRLAMELGGNAPFIVFDDADPESRLPTP